MPSNLRVERYFFKEYNSFSNDKNLRNIATGFKTNGNVKVDQAGEIKQ